MLSSNQEEETKELSAKMSQQTLSWNSISAHWNEEGEPSDLAGQLCSYQTFMSLSCYSSWDLLFSMIAELCLQICWSAGWHGCHFIGPSRGSLKEGFYCNHLWSHARYSACSTSYWAFMMTQASRQTLRDWPCTACFSRGKTLINWDVRVPLPSWTASSQSETPPFIGRSAKILCKVANLSSSGIRP